MTSSGQSRANYGRRFFWFAMAIVVGIGVYSAGWFYAARYLEDEVRGRVAGMNGGGRRANCEELQARGYPFRIGLFCRSVLYEDARRGLSVQARELRTAAQIYQPWRIVGELDGPAWLEAPGVNALVLDWANLRASARLARPLPQRISVEAQDLNIRRDEQTDTLPPLARFDSLEAHMRPAGDDIDLAVRFDGLKPDASLTNGISLPPLSGVADLSLAGAAAPGGLADGLEGSLRGHSGTIRSVTVSVEGGAGVTVSGPVSVDEAGLIDAELRISVREPLVLARILGDLAPHARREIELSFSAIAAMGGSAGMPLRIVKSEASLGFITLGTIPPL